MVPKLLRRAPALQVGLWLARNVGDAWQRLSPKERTELRQLVAKSRGRKSGLTSKEWGRVRELLGRAAKR